MPTVLKAPLVLKPPPCSFQSQEQQNLLCGHGVVEALSVTVQSAVPKLVQASLQTFSAVVYENKFTSCVVADGVYRVLNSTKLY